MPFPDEGGLVIIRLEKGSECGMSIGNSEILILIAERFLKSEGKPMRIPSRMETHARRRTNGGARIVVHELEAVVGQVIQDGRFVVRTSVAAEIPISHVVGKNKKNVGSLGKRAGRRLRLLHSQPGDGSSYEFTTVELSHGAV